jgi:hypothetical protein
MVLSIEERVVVQWALTEGNRYTYLVKEKSAKNFPETPVPHRDAVRRLIENFRETDSELDAEISGGTSKVNDKVFQNNIQRVQACIDARGHHFQHLL